MPNISRETAEFLLRRVLGTMTLSVGAPDFPEAAVGVLRARSELEAVIAAETTEPDTPPR